MEIKPEKLLSYTEVAKRLKISKNSVGHYVWLLDLKLQRIPGDKKSYFTLTDIAVIKQYRHKNGY